MTAEGTKFSRAENGAPMARPLRSAYGLYAITLFVVLGAIALLGMLLLPGVRPRRATARTLSRLFLTLAGIRLVVRGPHLLPQSQCVVASNHASYIDGVIFTAALPPRFGFVIKREMSRVPLAGLLLRRLGSEFVDRFNRQRGARDARRVLRAAAGGSSLVFFPEGTFPRTPGLLKFHTGAFLTALRVGCPVVPAVVRGSRAVLPPGAVLPRPGRLCIEILPPVHVESLGTEASAAALRDAVRAIILRELGEPDLTATCCDDTDRQHDTGRARSVPVSRP